MMSLVFARRPPAAQNQQPRQEAEGDEATRVRLAARPTTPANILHALADDPAITVRAAVAMNPSYAPAADRRLLADTDERIRMLLAGKVAALLPGLSGPDQSAAQAHVHNILNALADDAAVKVRLAIVDALTTMPEAPKELILKLARDPVIAVSNPVLRLSPLLTDADLLELLATPPHTGAMAAVASRTGIGAAVSDQIAAHADSAAVRTLLQNGSAAILEATLDSLIGRAADHPEWHEPLAHRPTLPVGALRALARIVAANVLDIIASRPDVPPAMAESLKNSVAASLDEAPPLPTEADILESVRQLKDAGQLTEDTLLEAAASGDRRRTAAMLSCASGATLAMLDRAVALRSGKALVSLVWKAGFSTHAGQVIQSMLGQLGPTEIIDVNSIEAFPFSPTEMDWQIELLGEPGR